ncbi:MAG: rod shape-determining protein MreD [Legionella sp.]|uniref:rod shape-determining protein MreD n=1 Tax=Legionella sp. TaxID=459 RepID=UPI0039E24240
MMSLRVRLSLAFIIMLSLSILPMPELISDFRPPWVLLLVLYIEYFLPGNFNQTTLLFVGLLLDVLLATVIGEHSFALLFVTWIASSKSRRFQFFSMVQQIFLVGFFCLLYQSIISIISAVLGFNYSLFMPLASAGVGMFLWPWLCLLGEDILLTRLVYR